MPRAFVLISFEEQFEPVWLDLIKAPLERAGYEVERADSRLDQRSILQNIFRGIEAADLIVADLTGSNPNVFYELGVAHALGIPTILLTQNLEELPFDLRAYTANEYSTHFSEASTIRETLHDIGRAAMDGAVTFSSPATDFLSGRGRARPQPPEGATADAPESESEMAHEVPETAWFDAVQEGEEASQQFLATMNRITEATVLVGEQIARHSETINEVMALPENLRMKRTSAINVAVARDLDGFAEALAIETGPFSEQSAVVLEGLNQYVQWAQAHADSADIDTVTQARDNARGLLEAIQESLPQVREFRQTILGLRGYSRPINAASGRAVNSMNALITGMEKIEAETARIVDVAGALVDTRGRSSEG
jgi:nucleoside 2-deoxyribosyltransferase